MKISHFKLICENFELLTSKVGGFRDYCFQPKENQIKQIKNFIKLLDKKIGLESIGNDWLFNYMVFQFSYRVDQKTRFDGKIQLNWIIGTKSYEIYENRVDNWLYFNSLFLKRFDIETPYIKETVMKIDCTNYENLMREENYRLEGAAILCMEETSGYSSKNKFCLRCREKNICKEMNEL